MSWFFYDFVRLCANFQGSFKPFRQKFLKYFASNPDAELQEPMDPVLSDQLVRWVFELRKGQELSLETAQLKAFLNDELQIPLNCLCPRLTEILSPMLVVFMLKWPMWNLIMDDKIELSYVVTKLKTYLKEKLENMIRHQYREYVGEIPNTPFSLSITCPPEFANSLFFVGSNDDVTVRTHGTPDWINLTTSQLIHWPFVEVYFKSQELSFSRKMDITYSRFLSNGLISFKPQNEPINKHIETSNITESNYKVSILESYIKVYLDVIKLTNDLSTAEFDEINSILNHILLDIKFCQHNNYITGNRDFVIKLGEGHKYSRVKNVPKNIQTNRVNYWEFLYTNMKFCLENFTAQPENGSDNCFGFLNTMKFSSQPSQILPKITYKCSFCNVLFDSKKLAVKHFKDCHKMEADLYCERCRKNWKMTLLAGDRYVHECFKN